MAINQRAQLITLINRVQMPAMLRPVAIMMIGQMSDELLSKYIEYVTRLQSALHNRDRGAMHQIAIEIADQIFDDQGK